MMVSQPVKVSDQCQKQLRNNQHSSVKLDRMMLKTITVRSEELKISRVLVPLE